MPLAGPDQPPLRRPRRAARVIAAVVLALVLPPLAPVLSALRGAVPVRRDRRDGRRRDERPGRRGRGAARPVDHVRAARHVERGRPARLGGGHRRRPRGHRRAAAPRVAAAVLTAAGPGRLPVGPRPARRHRGEDRRRASPCRPGRRCSSARSGSARSSPRGPAWTGRRSICATCSAPPPGVAAACTTGFALMMAAARLVGDAVVDRFGAVRTVRAGGVLAIARRAAVVVAAHPAGGDRRLRPHRAGHRRRRPARLRRRRAQRPGPEPGHRGRRDDHVHLRSDRPVPIGSRRGDA